MKTKIYFSVTFFTLLFLLPLSCKKDYPDDIPKWLKEEIQDCIRYDNRNRGESCKCHDKGGHLIITEYLYDGNTYYSFYTSCDWFVKFEWFTCDGDFLFDCQDWETISDTNSDCYKYSHSNIVRTVWEETIKY